MIHNINSTGTNYIIQQLDARKVLIKVNVEDSLASFLEQVVIHIFGCPIHKAREAVTSAVVIISRNLHESNVFHLFYNPHAYTVSQGWYYKSDPQGNGVEAYWMEYGYIFNDLPNAILMSRLDHHYIEKFTYLN